MNSEAVPGWSKSMADLPPLLPSGEASVEVWAKRADKIRAGILKLLGTGPAAVPEAAVEVLEDKSLRTHRRLLIRYRVEEDDHATAYLMMPHGLRKPVPAVLCMHQTTNHGKKEPAGLAGSRALAYARELCERGFVTIAPDCITAGARIDAAGPYDTAKFYEKHPEWSAVGKMLWDHQRALDVLVARPEVDATRIGSIGHSLGGHNSIWLAAFDPRIRASVSSCGWEPTHASDKPLCWSRSSWFIYIKSLRPYLLRSEIPFDFHEMIALVAPRAFLNVAGHGDHIFPHAAACLQVCEEAHKIWAIHGADSQCTWHFHEDGHAFRAATRRFTYDWLAAKLG